MVPRSYGFSYTIANRQVTLTNNKYQEASERQINNRPSLLTIINSLSLCILEPRGASLSGWAQQLGQHVHSEALLGRILLLLLLQMIVLHLLLLLQLLHPHLLLLHLLQVLLFLLLLVNEVGKGIVLRVLLLLLSLRWEL